MIIDEFQEMKGRKPKINELLSILLIEIQSLSNDLYEDISSSNITHLYAITEKDHCSSKNPFHLSNELSNLGDGVFSASANFLVEISRLIQKNMGQNPTLNDFCLILIRSLNDYDSSIFYGYSQIKAKYKKITPSRGDIISIPLDSASSEHSFFYMLVLIEKNQFGFAFGLFSGIFKHIDIHQIHHLKIKKYPIYSGTRFISNRKWAIIGNNPKALSLFPNHPEIFHYKIYNQDDENIGFFGSGESPNGTLRDLTEQEAIEIGLFSERYESTYLEEELKQALHYLTASN
jgi:hypothetical protein